MSKRKEATAGPPPLLVRLYGADRVLCLRDLLFELSRSSAQAQVLGETLVQPFDHAGYSSNLLNDTFCIVERGAPPLNDGFSLAQSSSQLELVHRAIEALLQSPTSRDNILAYGYRKKRPSTNARQLAGTANTEVYHPNAVADSLISPAWHLLLSRIGDTLMLYLLLHCSMFTRLANDCCLQLTGPPAVRRAREWRKLSAIPVISDKEPKTARKSIDDANTWNAPPHENLGGQKRKRSTDGVGFTQELTSMGIEGHLIEEPDVLQKQLSVPSMNLHTNAPMEAFVAKSKKKARPSSWQRRKNQTSTASEQQPAVDGTRNPASIPSTQPLSEAAEEGGQSKAADYGYSQWPRYMPKPTEMHIARASIFYCSTFPPRPGFAVKHIFNALRSHSPSHAGRVLYSAIFDPRHNPVGRVGNAYKPTHSILPPPARRVPQKHRHLLSVLEKIVKRASKCPFSALLNFYCPLPRQMQRGGLHPAAEPTAHQHKRDRQNGQDAAPRDNRSLSLLMDELYELDRETVRQEHEAKNGVHAARRRGLPTSQGTFHTTGRSRRIRTKTGLSLLIAEAESQLGGGMSSGGRPGANGTPWEEKSPRTQTLLTSVNTAAKLDIPATQPLLEEEIEEDARVETAAVPAQVFQVPAWMRLKDGRTTKASHGDELGPEALATCFIPHVQVSSYVWSVVCRLIPKELLGNARCKRALRAGIRRFVSLRRYEQMSVHQLMQRHTITGHAWLRPTGDGDAQVKKKAGFPPSQVAAHQRTLALWLGWLFSVVIVPLLRAHFYCTESEAYRQQVFYYRKPVWVRMAASVVGGLAGSQFAPIASGEAQKILQSRKLGVARLRLLPKRVGMRFIVNLGRKSKVVFRGPRVGGGQKHQRRHQTELNFASVNSHLQNIHHVLKYEVARQPAAIGASAFGYNDAYCRLQPFIRKWRAAAAAAATRSDTGRLLSTGSNALTRPSNLVPYIVSIDVSRAFDHVDVNTLLDIVAPLLQSDQYLVLKYTEIITRLGDVKVIPKRMAVPAADGALTVESDPFPTRAAQWSISTKSKLWVDGVVYERVRRNDALSLLKSHLTANLVRLRKAWHYQCRGIAQGGTLSTLLCCLYLAHVERVCLAPIMRAGSMAPHATPYGPRHIAYPGQTVSSRGRLGSLASAAAAVQPSPSGSINVTNSMRSVPSMGLATLGGNVGGGGDAGGFLEGRSTHSILLRLVDDWLLVSYHRAVAEGVARCLLAGIPEYNVTVNPHKTKLSFPMMFPDGEQVVPSLYSCDDGSRFIKWCGLLLNVDTLEIQGDYTRYHGEHISTALTVPLQRSPGAALGIKLCHYLRPKIHPLLLDPCINSPTTIRVNIYQAFALAAMKFHCYVKSLPATPAAGTKVLMEALEVGISFVCQLTRPRCVTPAHRRGMGVPCDPGISPLHVRYLGMHAFRRVLRRKQSTHGVLLQELDAVLASQPYVRCGKALADAVDPARSSVLDAIQY